MSTKYLLMQLEPNRDYSFEISKNMRIQPGDYNCTLQVSGPQGTLARENRKCSLAKAQQNSEPSQIPFSIEAEFAKQKAQEEMTRVDSVQASEIGGEETPQDVTAKKKTSNEGEDAAKIGAMTKDETDATLASSQKRELAEGSLPAETVEEGNDSSLPGSMPASSSSDTTKATFTGSSTSKKYHLLDCRYAAKIKPENKINFQSREDANRQGYLPCKSCNP